eukprot:766477-Hanusia_phi.AAC.2
MLPPRSDGPVPATQPGACPIGPARPAGLPQCRMIIRGNPVLRYKIFRPWTTESARPYAAAPRRTPVRVLRASVIIARAGILIYRHGDSRGGRTTKHLITERSHEIPAQSETDDVVFEIIVCRKGSMRTETRHLGSITVLRSYSSASLLHELKKLPRPSRKRLAASRSASKHWTFYRIGTERKQVEGS